MKFHEAPQFDLFSGMIDHPDGFQVRKHVRTSDPDTSRDAAESVADRVTLVQQRILEIHGDHDGMTDEELTLAYIDRYGPTGESSIRSRRHDLTLKGRFEDTGERRELSTGRKGIVWRLARNASLEY